MSTSESSTLQPNTPVPAAHPPTNTSKIPLLGEGFQESTNSPVSKSTDSSDVEEEEEGGETTGEGGPGKRRLFRFGKKKDDDKTKTKRKGDVPVNLTAGNFSTPIAQPIARRVLPQGSSPPRSIPNHPYQLPGSPQRNLYSSSPRIVSPAGSQIFERDVQESSLPVPNSPAIPSPDPHAPPPARSPPYRTRTPPKPGSTTPHPPHIPAVPTRA